MRTLTKVIYKPDPKSTEEYTIIVNHEDYNKWKEGDTTIPISSVVDSFAVFQSGQGSQGNLGQVSKQQLENTFGTSKDVDVVQIILQKGTSQPGSISEKTFQGNTTKGSAVIDTRGKGLSGI
ncbi:hypothetical protein E1B28_004669 [Marasmius oreades]|uniref:Ribosome maturation protein SDO1/SBDS N-terminal domain-containing protein n=1 Tax=Marasmius oreades TaxID=181124 RepID=A0A9P7UZ42_9AGAR|nr:uncharacterized protein E1B28_004669 [Marasmius oreades]KAG7097307.1 hypothetical protein E1B28_004669 [Marasmius oreades]